MLPAVIHRAELPIDDRPHGIDLTGDLLHAAVRRPGSVDVWYYQRPQNTEHMRRSFQIVGTGHPIPTWLSRHHATALTPDGLLVWHVIENACRHPLPDPEQMTSSPAVGTECPACGVGLSGKLGAGWRPV